MSGGRSTTVYRSGTPIVQDIVATEKALEIALKSQKARYDYVVSINKDVSEYLRQYKDVRINNTENSIPFVINFSINGVNSKDFVGMLDNKDVYVSSKTSCCPESSPSKLVYALTKDKKIAASSVRISFSHLTTKKEIEEFKKIFGSTMKEIGKDGKI